ncbi:PIG-L family deacetylase [Glycomyces sp. TRM65418]|uniref:PIG-L family deacetylase n=1 Tax=Glycomyces sp. TRM65418 TaxID=2867006 RepID=UPI001CE6B76B|nr:PIG-L family deacetylase [Glycomyces sp. TRM65418]MCC3764744.1 PIG-L family deacetylase [Glycomyces sp. TRM65418]QZD54400.1 PIG-L family deacetylase [Glycomyces sp. TRM65418]
MPSPRPALRRRDLLVGGMAGLAVTAGAAECAWSLREASGDSAFPEPARTGPVHMQIVAHPDDCLYFINPRVARVLGEGAGVCTVVLTAGEADGRNTWDRAAPTDFAGYAAARDNGLRRAYAQIALGDPDAPWDRHLAPLESGQEVELCVLRDKPEVHLVFCSLWTNLGRLTGQFTRLLALWEGRLDVSLVLPPTGSPLSPESTVDRATVQATLLELLDRYRPVVVNTLDPDPDPVVGARLGAEQTGYSDHIDHTAAALFAWEAVQAWGGARTVEAWRGYYNRRWPANLGEADLHAKGRAMDVYSWSDGADCGRSSDCGDRLISGPGAGTTYGRATHPRYTEAVVTAEVDDRIRPIAVRSSKVRVLGDDGWHDLGGPEVLPSLARAGTRLYAFSALHAHDPAAHVRDLHCYDLVSGQWQLLGNPAGIGEGARTVGQAAAADDGRLSLACVRDPDGGLAVRVRPHGGRWTDWTRLEGPPVHEAPAALAADGAFTIVAATPDNVAAWEGDGSVWAHRSLDLPGPEDQPYLPAGAVTAVRAPDGRIVIASRAAGGSDVVIHFGLGETWTGTRVPLEGGLLAPTLAIGPAAGTEAGGALAVVCDDGTGAPAMLVLDLAELDHAAESGGFALLSRPWTRGDITVVKRPAAAFDPDGTLRLWAVAADGELWTATAEPGGDPPAGWEPAA